MFAISAKISFVKSPMRPIIEPPNSTSTRAVIVSLGTKVSVCSLTEVAACTTPTARPTTSEAISTGAATSAVTQSILSARLRRLVMSSISALCLVHVLRQAQDERSGVDDAIIPLMLSPELVEGSKHHHPKLEAS